MITFSLLEFLKPDTITGQPNRYEAGLFDVSDPAKKKDLNRLEEFYIKGMVTIEQVNEIKGKITGTPPQYCSLVLVGEQASLIFFPRTKPKA